MRPHGGIRVREAEGNAFVRRLTNEQRTLIDDALHTGYLRRHEASRLAGEIDDYPIFPAGRWVILLGESAEPGPALMADVHAGPLSVNKNNVLFKLNTRAYPLSANAWDSLGDGYEATNDVQGARVAYARSVELNPGNEHARGELANCANSVYAASPSTTSGARMSIMSS